MDRQAKANMKYFYGLHRDRSLLKESGIPGRVAVFSSEKDLEKWIRESFMRRVIAKNEINKYWGRKGTKWFNKFCETVVGKEVQERDEMDELYAMHIEENTPLQHSIRRKTPNQYTLLRKG